MTNDKLFFVDPMSYHNLSEYDRCVTYSFDRFTNECYYFCNIKCDWFHNFFSIKAIYNYSGKNSFISPLSYIFSQFYLLYSFIVLKPRLIHLQWTKILPIDILVFSLFRLFGAKIVFTAHNSKPHQSNFIKTKLYHLFLKIFNLIIVHEKQTRDELIEKGVAESNIFVIPHPLIYSDFKVDLSVVSSSLRQVLDEIDSTLSLGLLGKSLDYKGYSSFLDFSEKISNKNFNIYCSDNSLSGSNVKYLPDNLSDNDFIAVLDALSFLVLPYKNISQSGILLTALARNKCVIVTDVGGFSFMANEFKELTYTLPKNYILDDIKSMFDFMNNFSKRESLENASSKFSSENVSYSTLKVYESLGFNLNEKK